MPNSPAPSNRLQSRLGLQRARRIRRRLQKGKTLTARQQRLFDEEMERSSRASWLAPLDGDDSPLSNMSEATYLELVDWTGRQIRSDKPGAVPETVSPILDRLDINTASWVSTVDHYGSLFYRVTGRVENMVKAAAELGVKWLCGMGSSRRAFGPPLQPA